MNDQRRKNIISSDNYIAIIIGSILTAVIGGRILFLVTNFNTIDSIYDALAPWTGGGSVLGCILAVLATAPLYAKWYRVPLLPLLDLAAIYTPLMQSVARIGCFFSGCCYGKPFNGLWAVIYTDPDSSAPLYQYLHPTQLYSSVSMFIIFLILYFLSKKKNLLPGRLIALYIALMSIERFSMDILRADQEFWYSKHLAWLSTNQWIALYMFVAASIGFLAQTYYTRTHEHI